MTAEITYETLFDLLRKESSKEDLQPLPQGFCEGAKAFTTKEQPHAGAAGHRASIEHENAKKILRELYDRRERKILLLALNKARADDAIIDYDVLLKGEQELFDALVKALTKHKRDALEKLGISGTPASDTAPAPKPQTKTLEEPAQEPKKPSEGTIRVKFLHAVPKFVGKDMTIFGPYDPGAEEELPEEIATVLLKKGRVEKA